MNTAPSNGIALRNVGKQYRAGAPVLSGIDLDIATGEFVAIVGASGCGKSTLLRVLAGLEGNYSGQVLIDGEPPRLPSPHVGVAFQEARLFPWLSVQRNVALGLQRLRLPRAEVERRVAGQLATVGLSEWANALPHQLSGGMAQRVSLARALIARPAVLLLDEPFSALDALTRAQMHELLLHLRSGQPLNVLMVTHDVEEAVYLADRVVVMSANPGRIRHVETIPLPHPRQRDSQPFQHLRHALTARVGDGAQATPAPELAESP